LERYPTSQVPAILSPKGEGEKEGAGSPATTVQWHRVTSATWAAAEAKRIQHPSEGRTAKLCL